MVPPALTESTSPDGMATAAGVPAAANGSASAASSTTVAPAASASSATASPSTHIDVVSTQTPAPSSPGGAATLAHPIAGKPALPAEHRITLPEAPPREEHEAAPASASEAPQGPIPELASESHLAAAGTAAPGAIEQPAAAPPSPEKLPSPEARQVLASVKVTLAQSQQGLKANVDAAAAKIEATATQQEAGLESALAARIEALGASFARLKAQTRASITGQIQHVGASATAARKRLDTWKASATTRVNTTVATQQQRAVTAGNQYADQVRASAEDGAINTGKQIDASIAHARSTGRVRATAKGSTDEITNAKAKVANDLADETVSQLQDASDQAAGEFRNQGADIGKQLVDQATSFGSQVAAQASTIVGQVNDVDRSTTETIGRARTSATDSLRKLESQVVNRLAAMEREVVRSLRAQAGATRAQLEAMKNEAQQTLHRQEASARSAGDKALGDFAAGLGNATITPEMVPTLSAQGLALVQQAHATAGAEVEASARQPADQIGANGAKGIAELAAGAERATGQASQVNQQASEQAARIGRQSASQLEATVSQSTAAGENSVTEALTGLNQQVDDLDAQLSHVVTNFNNGLGDQIVTAMSKASQPVSTLDSRIDQAQQKAEEQLSKSWFERQWDDLKALVSSPSFWVGLVVGLAVGALIILTAGAATPFVIMVAAVAAGAAGAAAGTIASNIQHGRPVFENVLRNSLVGAAAGAIGAAVFLFGAGVVAGAGLTGLAAGVAGFALLEVSAIAANTIANLLSGQPWDKNLLAAMLLAPLIAAAAKALGIEPEVGEGEEEGAVPRVNVADLPPEVAPTLNLIDQGGPFPYARDGIPFGNREGLLPQEPAGYYREYTVPTPGVAGRGAQRIVTGAGGEAYYTPDHYQSFQRIR